MISYLVVNSDLEGGKSPHLNSTSVVLYLKQFHTPVPNGDTNGSSARIQTVFKQFFECRSRTMYDLKKKTGMASERARTTTPTRATEGGEGGTE